MVLHLYLTTISDLDVLITCKLTNSEWPNRKNCIINTGIRRITGHKICGNSSVLDSMPEIRIMLMKKSNGDRSLFNTEQAFLTYALGDVAWWPDYWVKSFKRHSRRLFPLNIMMTSKLPKKCKILVFHGRPDPEEALNGFSGKKFHHKVIPTPWIKEFWKD